MSPSRKSGSETLDFLGEQVGPYSIKSEIGHGGFGIVYLAEQLEPVRRNVALKVIKAGMDTREFVRRFEAERQALAIMDHPNIAHVLDAGATSLGRPYFAMELVRGIPITEFCDSNRLSLEARLSLFQQVCRGVQHAHQKGVIHRDLKPSNILVTNIDSVPSPKIIDFGVAKVLGDNIANNSLLTENKRVMGTPTYMSPEQAGVFGMDIDSRTDIYSLGILLYELLTGFTPLDIELTKNKDPFALRDLLKDFELKRPSSRLQPSLSELKTISKARGTTSAKLIRSIQGDLDWISMKCLEKDRNRRYETPEALLRDIERHLSNEPVEATPPSSLYRLKKYLSRNKVAFASAASVILFLSYVIASVSWSAIDSAAEQRLIREELERAIVDVQRLTSEQPTSAQTIIRRANALLTRWKGDPELSTLVHQWNEDIELVIQLRQIEQDSLHLDAQNSTISGIASRYESAFAKHGISFDQETMLDSSEIINESPNPIQNEVVIALTRYLLLIPEEQRASVLSLVRDSDSDPWRHELWTIIEKRDQFALEEFAFRRNINTQPAINIRLLADLVKPSTAVSILREAQATYPQDYWLNNRLSGKLIGFTRPEESKNSNPYWVSMDSHGDNADVFLNLGRVLIDEDRPEEAIPQLKRALDTTQETDGNIVPILTTLGHALESIGDPKEAILHYRRAISVNPNFRDARIGLATALAATSEVTSAAEHYATRLHQDDFPIISESPGKWTVISENDKLFQEITKFIPNDYRPWAIRAHAFCLKQEWVKAASDFVAALKIVPSHGTPWFQIQARLTFQIAKYPEAFRLVRQKRPNDLRLLIGLARKKVIEGNISGATAALEERLNTLSSPDHFSLFMLAHLYYLQDDLASYRNVCDRILEIAEIDQATHHLRRYVRACLLSPTEMLHRIDEIEHFSSKSISQLNNESVGLNWYKFSRGLLEYRRDNFEAARDWITSHSTGSNEWEIAANFLLSMMNFKEGKTELSQELYQRAITLSESNRPITDSVEYAISLHDWLLGDFLKKEAEQLFNNPRRHKAEDSS